MTDYSNTNKSFILKALPKRQDAKKQLTLIVFLEFVWKKNNDNVPTNKWLSRKKYQEVKIYLTDKAK